MFLNFQNIFTFFYNIIIFAFETRSIYVIYLSISGHMESIISMKNNFDIFFLLALSWTLH
jgi:hypothetical protein